MKGKKLLMISLRAKGEKNEINLFDRATTHMNYETAIATTTAMTKTRFSTKK